MDGRLATVLVGFVIPFILLGVTIVYFGTNPLSVLVLFSVIVGAAFYLITYSDAFGGAVDHVSET